MKKILIVLVIIVSFGVTSCGTILKPYQINKPHSGQIDVAIVALDTASLFLFLIPGIIAFGVDYSNGTLYLPRGKR